MGKKVLIFISSDDAPYSTSLPVQQVHKLPPWSVSVTISEQFVKIPQVAGGGSCTFIHRFVPECFLHFKCTF